MVSVKIAAQYAAMLTVKHWHNFVNGVNIVNYIFNGLKIGTVKIAALYAAMLTVLIICIALLSGVNILITFLMVNQLAHCK